MTASLLPLRDYQTQAIRELHTRWDGGQRRVAVVLPTGAGKTVVFSHLAEAFLAANPGKRVLVLSHTDELVGQAANKMRAVAPHRTVGIVKAAQNEVHAEVISASVQSLRSAKRREQVRNVGLIIVDECHHATARTYRTILEHFGAIGHAEDSTLCAPGDHPLVAGFTATLVRGDKAKLSEVWEDVALRLSIAFMIRAGYLLDVKGKQVEVPSLDLRGVKQSGGDYQEGALGDALVEAFAPEIVAKRYAEVASDRKGIVFAPTVDSAYAFERAFNDQGIKTETVHGGLGRDERRAILARFRDGTTQVVSNCMVLTEGFDEPSASCAVIARPTKNAGLYQQMVGRVLRPDLTLSPQERGHALILDVVGISRRHDLRSLVDLSTREDLPEDVDEDLSLLELEDLLLEGEQEAPGLGAEAPVWYAGETTVTEFDPLGRDSDRTWGVTPDGTYYLPAGAHGYIFLAESIEGDPGTYDVVSCAKQPVRGQQYVAAQITEHRGLDFQMACAWGEEEALKRGGHGAKTLTEKKARWRKEPASAAQIHHAQRARKLLDVRWVTQEEDPFSDPPIPKGSSLPFRTVKGEHVLVTKGEASEVIESAAAARAIDSLVQFVKNRHTQQEG